MSQVWGSSVNQNANTWIVGLSHACFCTVRVDADNGCRKCLVNATTDFTLYHIFKEAKIWTQKISYATVHSKNGSILCYPILWTCSLQSPQKVLGGSNRLDWQLEIIFGNCVFELLEIPCIICWIFPCIGGNCDQTANAFCPIIKIVIIFNWTCPWKSWTFSTFKETKFFMCKFHLCISLLRNHKNRDYTWYWTNWFEIAFAVEVLFLFFSLLFCFCFCFCFFALPARKDSYIIPKEWLQ